MKKVIKYITIFFITILILFSILVVMAKIPRESISENIKQSAEVLKPNRGEIDEVVRKRDYTFRHVYADAMLLNIIWCIDTDDVVKSVMEAKYYSEKENKEIEYDLTEMIENQKEGNVQYIRYWHGSISIIKPLLVYFDLGQIYIINAVILAILTIILLIQLWKTKIKELFVAFIIGLIMTASVMVPFCLEYTWTYLIMLIISIISIKLEQKQKNINPLFLISGILTCYFDFLSTEIITLFVPVIMILIIRMKEKRIVNIKEGIIFLLKPTILWGLGYVGMWLAKWILASVILNVNTWDFVKDNMIERINGQNEYMPSLYQAYGIENLPLEAVIKNLLTLYPINIVKRVYKLCIIPVIIIVFEIIFIKKKNIKELWKSLLLLCIAFIPYIRYMILADHSYRHYLFTFRSQIITIMALILAIVYSINKDILYKIKNIRKTNVSIDK